MNIEIAPNSRTFVVGMTGSGKTYLSKELLADVPRLVVFNSKDNPELAEDMRLERGTNKHWSQLLRGLPMRINVPDAPESADRAGYFNEMCRRVRAAANCMVYIDEVLDVLGESFNPKYHLRSLFSKGREPIRNRKGAITSGNIGVVASTQRPARIPLIMMTEAENFFAFRLQYPEDQKTMAGYMRMAELPDPPDEHGFYYKGKAMREAEYVAEL